MGLESTLSNPSFQKNAISNVGNAAPKSIGGGGANAASTIAMIAEIGTGIATTIAGVQDEKKRNAFTQNLQLLSLNQQETLAKALNNAKSSDERLKILGLALTDMSKQRINNIQELVTQQEKDRRTQMVSNAIQLSAFFIVAGIIIYFVAKKGN